MTTYLLLSRPSLSFCFVIFGKKLRNFKIIRFSFSFVDQILKSTAAASPCALGMGGALMEPCINPYAARCPSAAGQYCTINSLQINPMSAAYVFPANSGFNATADGHCLVSTSTSTPYCPPNYVYTASAQTAIALHSSTCYFCIRKSRHNYSMFFIMTPVSFYKLTHFCLFF